MAVIEYDSYKQKLLAMDETFENLFKRWRSSRPARS